LRPAAALIFPDPLEPLVRLSRSFISSSNVVLRSKTSSTMHNGRCGRPDSTHRHTDTPRPIYCWACCARPGPAPDLCSLCATLSSPSPAAQPWNVLSCQFISSPLYCVHTAPGRPTRDEFHQTEPQRGDRPMPSMAGRANSLVIQSLPVYCVIAPRRWPAPA